MLAAMFRGKDGAKRGGCTAEGSVQRRNGELGGDALISRRHVLAGYFIWVTLLIVAYYWLPSLRAEAWGLIGLSGVAAIVAGILINRPARKAPWLLLAGANLSFTAGQVSFLVLTQIGAKVPFPSFADLLYLALYPLVAAGLLIF